MWISSNSVFNIRKHINDKGNIFPNNTNILVQRSHMKNRNKFNITVIVNEISKTHFCRLHISLKCKETCKKQ